MSGTQDMSVVIATASLDTTRLGGAPQDGDFARLLQAASQPAAHRLHRIVQALPEPGMPRAQPDSEDPQSTSLIDGLFGRTAPAAPGASGRTTASPHAMLAASAPHPELSSRPDTSISVSGRAQPSGAGMLQRWAQKSPKDRAVSALFFVAAAWIGLAILGQLVSQFEDHAGLLILLAIGAFVFFGRRAQRARDTSGPAT